MKVLIAEDDAISRRMLEAALTRSGHEVVAVENGTDALERLIDPSGDPPRLAVLDWMMPGLDGPDVCRRLRERPDDRYRYLILLTARGQKEDIVEGLDAGADDYLIKPFDLDELQSRLRTGERILSLQADLARKVDELEDALAHVQTLQGLLPICMHCKKIRDDSDTWHRLETYIADHSSAAFTHSLCEDCLETHYGDRRSG